MYLDNFIEHLSDTVIKEALFTKQYHNVLRQIESGNFQSTNLQNEFSRSEKQKDCKYNPTPISKLKSDKLGLHGKQLKCLILIIYTNNLYHERKLQSLLIPFKLHPFINIQIEAMRLCILYQYFRLCS